MRSALAAGLCAAALLLAGCSSGSNGSLANAAAGAVGDALTDTSVAATAERAGCVTYTSAAQSDLELFVAEGGRCELANGHTVTVRRFADTDAMQSYWQAAEAFGSDQDLTAAAGLVTFEPDVVADLDQIRANLR